MDFSGRDTPNLSYPTFNNSGFGGSSITYNNVWRDSAYDSLLPGNSQSGFTAHITDLIAPTSVHWFAFTYDPTAPVDLYTGGGNFYGGSAARDVGFEGVASPSAVPDAGSTIALLGVALTGLAGFRRKFGI